jgi:hypothetical protein
VCREYRQITDLIQEKLQLSGVDTLALQFAEGFLEGPGPQHASLLEQTAAVQVLGLLFGDVDQAEIGVKRTDDQDQIVLGKGVDETGESLPEAKILPLVEANVSLAQLLHSVEYAMSGLLAQDLSQQVAEQLDPATERFTVEGLFFHVFRLL